MLRFELIDLIKRLTSIEFMYSGSQKTLPNIPCLAMIYILTKAEKQVMIIILSVDLDAVHMVH